MTRVRKLPPPAELAGAVNRWLVAGRSHEQIAAEYNVSWSAVQKSLHRAGYSWNSLVIGWFQKEVLCEHRLL